MNGEGGVKRKKGGPTVDSVAVVICRSEPGDTSPHETRNTTPLAQPKPNHIRVDDTHPVPLNRCPALNPLVLNFHV